jgi:hypothetical protein
MAQAFLGAGDSIDGTAALPRDRAARPPLAADLAGYLLLVVTAITAAVVWCYRSATARPGLTVDTTAAGLAVGACLLTWGPAGALGAAGLGLHLLNARYGTRR